MNVSVVIPVYNERKTIEEIIRRVLATGLPSELIIIDDYSTDGTRDFLKKLSISGENNNKLPSIPHLR